MRLFYTPLLWTLSLNKYLVSVPYPVFRLHIRSKRNHTVAYYFTCCWSHWFGSLGMTADVTSIVFCATSFLSDWVWGHSRAVLPIACPSGTPSVLFILTHAPSDSCSVCQVEIDEAWLLLPVLPVCSVALTDFFFLFTQKIWNVTLTKRESTTTVQYTYRCGQTRS